MYDYAFSIKYHYSPLNDTKLLKLICKKKTNFFFLKVVFALVWVLKPTGANLPSALDMGGNRTRRGISCRDDLEHLIGNICCLNCPAGKPHGATCDLANRDWSFVTSSNQKSITAIWRSNYLPRVTFSLDGSIKLPYIKRFYALFVCVLGTRVKSACTRAGEKGECEECDYGTYTEHANGLDHCFKCTQCRPGNSAWQLYTIDCNDWRRKINIQPFQNALSINWDLTRSFSCFSQMRKL